ncbi:MutS protein msh4 [Dimargaris verticillata]|uniref:MutS protein msh4 n=1 Tax=Dimargaris verticillata TaxID=2761393 RepID=A0A9W8B383_9FUNG|nr:MutS protein msh4 [Dimargaris verticillata]
MKDVKDLDALVIKINQKAAVVQLHHVEQNLNCLIGLSHSLKAIHLTACSLDGYSHPILVESKQLMHQCIETIQPILLGVLHEEATAERNALSMRHIRCYAVKPGFSQLLDVARQVYQESIDDVYVLVQGYCVSVHVAQRLEVVYLVEAHALTLKLQFKAATGFYLTIPFDQVTPNGLPVLFINVIRKKRHLHFTTLEIVKLNERINNALHEINLMSDKALQEVLAKVQTHTALLYQLSQSLAELDLVLSFANQCTLSEYGNKLHIAKGRHPVLDKVQALCLLQLMAQMGSFIPAQATTMKPVDAILCHFCDEEISSITASSFTAEMTNIAHILHASTTNALVVIDELGRAPGNFDMLQL